MPVESGLGSRPLGETGLSVTPIGLGLAALGRPGYINLGHAADLEHDYRLEAMQSKTHAALDAAWDAGVRYFDAARSYGRAEEFLGGWLRTRGIDPQDVVVGSKWGYTYTAGWKVEAEKHEVKDHSSSVLERQYAESKSLLGGYLDLYQIHSATLDSGVLGRPGVLKRLASLRDSGLVIGLSLSGPKQSDTLARALDVEIDGRRVFGCVQATWNLLEPSAGLRLAEARQAGLGVIVKEALANGRLTVRNGAPEFAERRKVLESASQSLGVTIDALALAAVLAQPWADLALSGAANAAQLHSNLRALSIVAGSVPLDELGEIAEEPEAYWALRGRLEWN